MKAFDDLAIAPLDDVELEVLGTDSGKSTEYHPRVSATPFQWLDPTKIPPRRWVYGFHYIRRFVSTTVAAGGVGKSSLSIVEALSIATGRPLLGIKPNERTKVWLWNGEDPLEELQRRVAAAMIRYGIRPEEVEGWLFLDSGRTSEIVLASQTKVERNWPSQ